MTFKRAFVILMCLSSIPTYGESLQSTVNDVVEAATAIEEGRPAGLSQNAFEAVNNFDKVVEKLKPELSRARAEFNGTEFQQRVQDSQSSIRSLLLQDQLNQTQHTDKVKSGVTALLFVSASVPVHTLRNYVLDIAKIDGVMVLRGMIEPSEQLKPTLAFIRRLLMEDPNCEGMDCPIHNIKVAVDPERFRHYQINQVPALVVENDSDFSPLCQIDKPYQPLTGIVYGDAALGGLLRASNQPQQTDITRMIDILEGENPDD